MLNNSYSQTITVEENQTAAHLGSGTLLVFSTPAMVALMENTAIQCLSDLAEGNTSVGISININHLKAIRVGSTVQCTAGITAIEGRKYKFHVRVTDGAGELVGEGSHERMVVNEEKFMAKIL